ncbi:MAG: S49 family peptidase [Nitrospirae bacterium]|nr:S49 family peptidase [Nitrospirota bacterium]
MLEFNHPWAIKPTMLQPLADAYASSMREAHFLAVRSTKPAIPSGVVYELRDGIAVIRLYGVLMRREPSWSGLFDVTSTALTSEMLRLALSDSSVRAIVLAVHSPGGAVDGTQELARQVYAARRGKPIVAYAEGLMASAAYWIGAAADQVYISSDTTELGSIGVVATHVDISRAEDARGIKTTEIVAGQYKRVASMHQPLSTLGRTTLQEQVNQVYSVFVEDVATFRRTTPETVIRSMADGRIFLGRSAIAAGLADGKTTLDALTSHLRTSTASMGPRAQKLLLQFKNDVSLQRQYGSINRYAEECDPSVLHGYDQQVPNH